MLSITHPSPTRSARDSGSCCTKAALKRRITSAVSAVSAVMVRSSEPPGPAAIPAGECRVPRLVRYSNHHDHRGDEVTEGQVLEPRPIGSGGWIRRLSPFLLAHRGKVIIASGAASAGQAVAAVTPVFEKVIIDDGIVHQTRPVGPWLGLLVLAGIFSFYASYLRRWVGGRVSLGVQFDLRNAIYERLQRLDFAGHDQLQTGQLVSRASSDLGLLQALLSFLPIMLGNIVTLALSLVIMLILSPPLALIMLIAMPLLLFVSLRLRSRVFPATWDAQQRAGEVAGVVDEAVTGVRVVKGFGQEDRELGHLADRSA